MEEQTVHDVIAKMDDFERGWYHACITTLWWNSIGSEHEQRIPVEATRWLRGTWLITTYSQSGTNVPAPSFYQEGAAAPDAREYFFDPEKFQAVWRELDSEASIQYYRLFDVQSEYVRELVIQIRSTEDEHGLPNDWDLYPSDFKNPIHRITGTDELESPGS